MTGADRRFVNGFVTGPGGRKSRNGADQGETPERSLENFVFQKKADMIFCLLPTTLTCSERNEQNILPT